MSAELLSARVIYMASDVNANAGIQLPGAVVRSLEKLSNAAIAASTAAIINAICAPPSW
jgi:hypothetical protein